MSDIILGVLFAFAVASLVMAAVTTFLTGGFGWALDFVTPAEILERLVVGVLAFWLGYGYGRDSAKATR